MTKYSPILHPPLDDAFNDAVLKIAGVFVPIFIVSNNAPATYNELVEHVDMGNTMIVAEDGSGTTIFGKPEVNFAFRAWHDWTHWHNRYDFSLYGESATCSAQIGHLFSFFGVTSQTMQWSQYLVAEIIGQRQYYQKYKEYINDQRAFAVAYLADPVRALKTKW